MQTQEAIENVRAQVRPRSSASLWALLFGLERYCIGEGELAPGTTLEDVELMATIITEELTSRGWHRPPGSQKEGAK